MKIIEKRKINIANTIIETGKTLKNSILKVAAFEIMFNIMLVVFLKPIAKLVFNITIKLAGFDALTNDMVFKFFLSPIGIVMGSVFLIIAIIVVYYEFSVILILLKSGMENEKITIGEALKKGLSTFKPIFSICSLGFAAYTLVLMPFLNMGIHTSLIKNFEIPNFILEETMKYGVIGLILILLILVLGVYFFTQAFYVLPLMVFEKMTFYNAFKRSKKILKGSKAKLLSVVIVSSLVWGLITLLMVFINSILRLNMATLNFKIFFTIITVILEIYASPLLLAVILVCYKQHEGNVKTDFSDEKINEIILKLKNLITYCQNKIAEFFKWLKKNGGKLWKKHPAIISVTSVLVMFFSTVATINHVTAKEPFKPTDYIIGHRGSKNGVENSLEAIMAAYEAGADYVEIDVLLSKDGIPMVIHDFNLFRLTGKIGNIYDYTKDELQEKFIQKQNGYTSKILTLEELCVATKSKIKLLVELKSHGKETQRVSDKAVEIIKKYNMEQEVKFLSTEYALVKEMKTFHPKYEMGYILVTKIGNISASIFNKLEADYFGVEETIADENLIKAIHVSGKPIYIWTVNEVDDAKEYFSMGVDGIITDFPEIMKKLHEKYEGGKRLATMLEK